jgi:hypothetical protein
MHYEPLPVPTLYIGRVEDLLGRVSASSTVTPPLQFLTCTQHDKSRPSNLAVPTVKDLHHAGIAMFTRSTHGCGILAGPSLELEGFRLQKQKGSEDSPGLNFSETSRLAWEARKASNVAAE